MNDLRRGIFSASCSQDDMNISKAGMEPERIGVLSFDIVCWAAWGTAKIASMS
jgi:hypothetical protein